MTVDVMKMSNSEKSSVASNFVPLGKEKKVGDGIAAGVIDVDLSKKLPDNLSLAQAWAKCVLLNHPEKLEELGTTRQGYSYGELMWKIRSRDGLPRNGVPEEPHRSTRSGHLRYGIPYDIVDINRDNSIG